MKVVIRKDTQEVVMYADGDIHVDRAILEVKEMQPSIEEKDKLLRNCPAKIVKDKFLFEESTEEVLSGKRDLKDSLLSAASDKGKTVEERMESMVALLRQSNAHLDQS